MKEAVFCQREGVGFFRFGHLEVPHGFSTRIGGVSEGPYASLNLGLSTGDVPERVAENRRRLGAVLGAPVNRTLAMEHGARVAVVRRGGEYHRGDGCVTDRPGVALAVTVADCVAIFFYDPLRGAVGLAHAGWRGTLAGVAGEVLRTMAREFGTRPACVQVALGPAIGPCCFEVGREVAARFLELPFGQDLVRWRCNTAYVDLWEANRRLLLGQGVAEGAVRVVRRCTFCNPQLFFSHRRDRRVTGRMAAVIAAR